MVKGKLDKLEYVEPGIIKHLVGIFLFLADEGIFEMKLNETASWLKNIIEQLYNESKMKPDSRDGFRDDAYAGLCYHFRGKKEFKDLLEIIYEKDKELKASLVPDVSKSAMKLFKEDPNKFWLAISFEFNGERDFKERAILLHIDVKNFVELFLKTPNNKKQYINYAIKDRYKMSRHYSELRQELPWLKSLIEELESRVSKLGTLNALIVKSFIKQILEPAVSLVEEIEAEQNKDL